MLNTDGRSLYLAHLDLDPIEMLIAQTKIALEATISYYSNEATKAMMCGDMETENNAMETQALFAGKISCLNYEAVLLILMSRLEEALTTWCRAIHIENADTPEFETYKSRGGILEKTANYLKECEDEIQLKNDIQWEYITVIRDARNDIVHNGGRSKLEHRAKFKKFSIGMRTEDFSVYIDYDTLKRMYSAIIGFCDRTFNLRGQAFIE